MNKKNVITGLWIGLFALVILSILLFKSPFAVSSLSTSTVYTPTFTNVQCAVVESNHIWSRDYASLQDSNGWATLYCSNGNMDVYTNQCALSLTTSTKIPTNVNSLYICPIGTSFADKDKKCNPPLTGAVGVIYYKPNQIILINMDAKFLGFIGGNLKTGEVTVNIASDWYGLRTVDSNNFLTTERTCNINNLRSTGTWLSSENSKAPSGILPFNAVINYISGQTPTISKNVITYNNQKVWTIGNRIAYPIATDDNGIRFVNLLNPLIAPDLICNPATPYCADDGKSFINIDTTAPTGSGKTCNELYGSFLNSYVPKSTNPSQICTMTCSNGALTYDQCKSIPTCNSGQTLNVNYDCVGIVNNKVSNIDLFPFYIAIGFLIGLILILIVAISKRRK
jgi:hypothetical protein